MSNSTSNLSVPSDLYYDTDSQTVRVTATRESVADIHDPEPNGIDGWSYDADAVGRLFAASLKLLALAVEYEKNIEWTGAPDDFCQRLRAVIAEVKGGGQ